MKNQLIRNRYTALVALSQRVLPSPSAVNKVATLLVTRFEAPYRATETARKGVLARHPVPDSWDKPGLPEAVAQARQAEMDRLMEESTPVRAIPDALRLTMADLPRRLEREGGEKNVEGLAEIRVLLGSLYVPSAEERRVMADASDGEEPDELPPAAPLGDDGLAEA